MFQFGRFINPQLRIGKIKMSHSDQLIAISKMPTSLMAKVRYDQYLKMYSHSRLIQNPISGFCSKQQHPNQNREEDVKQNEEQKQKIETTSQSNNVENTKEEFKEKRHQVETNYTAIAINMLIPIYFIGSLILDFGFSSLSPEQKNTYGLLMAGYVSFLTLITIGPFCVYWAYRMFIYLY